MFFKDSVPMGLFNAFLTIAFRFLIFGRSDGTSIFRRFSFGISTTCSCSS